MSGDLRRLLDELEQAHGKATPGEWEARSNMRIEDGCRCLSCWEPIEGSWDIDPVDGPDCPDHDCFHAIRLGQADAEFIAAAHNALGSLTTVARACLAVHDALEQWGDALTPEQVRTLRRSLAKACEVKS